MIPSTPGLNSGSSQARLAGQPLSLSCQVREAEHQQCCFSTPPNNKALLVLHKIFNMFPPLISGNELLFSLETASDYVKDEKACFYGFKCVAVGYEFNPGPDEVQTPHTVINQYLYSLFLYKWHLCLPCVDHLSA